MKNNQNARTIPGSMVLKGVNHCCVIQYFDNTLDVSSYIFTLKEDILVA